MADKARQGSKVDLNVADRDELAAVPGIGASTADAIIAYRKEQGGFKKVDELEAVSGIGKQTLESIRGRFKITADTKPGNGKGGNGKSGNGKAAESAEKRPETGTTADKRPETLAAMSPAGAGTPPKAAEQAAEAASGLRERGAEAAKQAAAAQVEAMRNTSEKAAEAAQQASQGISETLSAPGEPARRGAEAFASMGRRNVEGLQASGTTMLEAVRDLQEEWLSFWQTQVQESVRTTQALASCRTPQDFMEVQAQFTRSSMERFLAETGRLRDLTTRMMALGFEPLQTATRRNMREAAERMRD